MPYLHTVSDRSDNFGTYTDYDPLWPLVTDYLIQPLIIKVFHVLTHKGMDSLSVKIRFAIQAQEKVKKLFSSILEMNMLV